MGENKVVVENPKKKYLVTALTLGCITAASALLIGLTNMITRNQIIQNEQNKVLAGIASIFGENSKIASEGEDSKEDDYVTYYYEVKDNENNKLGYAFRTTGSNMYGKISLIIGFNEENRSFAGLSIVTNEQTYATTLVDNYIDPLNKGEAKIDDVSCGATYGAKLVRSMINDAKETANKMWKK